MDARTNTGLPAPHAAAVALIFHEWNGRNTATFEYHHHEDVEKDRRGEAPTPCVVVLPYDEGLTRYEQESA